VDKTDLARIFVSYAREDEKLVSILVAVMRLTGRDIFHDKDILPGQKWEPKIWSSLDTASVVMICWCAHSAASEWVKREYLKAVEADKSVVPVILDDTPLPDKLAQYQWIDARELGDHSALQDKIGFSGLGTAFAGQRREGKVIHKIAKDIIARIRTMADDG
jgi:hypothetical protein